MYQTIDQLRQRISQEVPTFDPIADDALLRTWVWSAMKIIDSERLFEKAEATIRVVGGKGDLPIDFSDVYRLPIGCSLRPHTRHLMARTDGEYSLGYWAIPVDEQGFPLIPDVAEDAIVAYLDYKSMELDQKKRQVSSGYQFRIDANLNRYNEQRATNMLVDVRGRVNTPSIEESIAFARYRQLATAYRTR